MGKTSRLTRLVAGLMVVLLAIAADARGGEPKNGGRAERPPRKVTVGTVIFSPGGKYPGLEKRLELLSGLVTEMATEAKRLHTRSPRGLDLAVLPEDAVTAVGGTAAERSIPLEGPVLDTFSLLARRFATYILAPMDLVETGPSGRIFSNAAVLFDRNGKVAGIYRKAHPVALVGSDSLEGGITPGKSFDVFDCDFGRLGVQICWDNSFEDGWEALAKKGADIVVWPSASPATILPASRAARHRYYVVSSCWRNNATIYEPTGMVAARVEEARKVLVREIDLSFAVLGWSSFLRDGKALSEKFGDKVSYHYSPREDIGLFWSNDPNTPIASMIRSIGGEEIDRQIDRNRALHDAARGGSAR